MAASRSIRSATLFALARKFSWPATLCSLTAMFAKTPANCCKRRARRRQPPRKPRRDFAERLLFLVIPSQTSIDDERSSRDVTGFIGREKRGDGGDIFRFPQPAQRNIFQETFQLDGIVQQVFVDRRFDRAGSDVIDGDIQRRQLDRKISREHFEGALTRAVGRKMREGKLFVNGTDIDYFSG